MRKIGTIRRVRHSPASWSTHKFDSMPEVWRRRGVKLFAALGFTPAQLAALRSVGITIEGI